MLNEWTENGHSEEVPTFDTYLRVNPKAESLLPTLKRRSALMNSGTPLTAAAEPTGPMCANVQFSSLQQFNETFGDARSKLVLKKISSQPMTSSELEQLTELNETFRSLLTDKESADDRFLADFVQEFGSFDAEIKPKPRTKRVRSRK